MFGRTPEPKTARFRPFWNVFWFFCMAVVLWGSQGGCAKPTHGAFSLTPDSPRLQAARNPENPSYEDQVIAAWIAWMYDANPGEAERRFQSALDLEPFGGDARFGMGLLSWFQGRNGEALACFLRVIQYDPASPEAEISGRLVERLYGEVKGYREQTAPVMDFALDDPRTTPVLRTIAAGIKQRIHESKAEFERAKRAKRRLGNVETWLYAGPFGRYGWLEIDERFLPEQPGTVKAVYPTLRGETQTHEIDLEKATVRFQDIAESGGVFYAAAYFHLQSAERLQFTLESRDPAVILLDDQPAFMRDTRKGVLPPETRAALWVEAGWHKLLVKVGAYWKRSDFKLSVIRRDGLPVVLDWRATLDDQPAYQLGNWREDEPLPDAAETCAALLERYPRDRLLRFQSLLANWLKKDFEAIERLLPELDTDLGGFAAFQTVRGEIARENPQLPQGLARDISLAAYRKAVEIDPSQAIAQFRLAEVEIEEDRIDDAIARFQELKNQAPDNYAWDHRLYELYSGKEWKTEAEEALAAALALNDENLPLLQTATIHYFDKLQIEKAKAFETRILELDPDNPAPMARLEGIGEGEKAIALWKKRIERHPEISWYRLRLAELYRAQNRVEEALGEYAALNLRPGNAYSHAFQRADLEFLDGNPQEALRILDEALADKPRTFSARRFLSENEGRELLERYRLDGMEIIREFQANRFASDAGELLVLDSVAQVLYEDGTELSRVHNITLMQSKEALDRHSEISLPGGAVLYRARLVKPDGRTFQPLKFDGKKSLSFPDAAIGDFIEMDYATSNSPSWSYGEPHLEGGFYFQMPQTPVYRSRFVVMHPEGMEVEFAPRNYEGSSPVETTDNGWRVRTWENRRLEELVPEPMGPPSRYFHPKVTVVTPKDWETLRDFYRQKIRRLNRPSVTLERFLAEHDPGPEVGDYRRAETLFYALAEVVNGDGKAGTLRQDATSVLLSKKGNRTLVLAALLDMVGIRNRFVLARPVTFPEPETQWALNSVYDDLMLEVFFDDHDPAIVDSERKRSFFGRTSPILSGSKILPLEDGPVFARLPVRSAIPDMRWLEMAVQVTPEGNGNIAISESAEGYYSAGYRNVLERIPADRLNMFLESLLNTNFWGAKLHEFDIVDLEDPAKPLRLNYDFSVLQLARRTGSDTLRLEKGFYPLKLTYSYIKMPMRRYPLYVNAPNGSVMQVELSPPEGYRIASFPESQEIRSRFGVVRFTVELKEGRLMLLRRHAIPVQVISPEDYAEFFKFCREVDRYEKIPIVFEKLGPMASLDAP